MAGELYSLYIPKYKNDTASASNLPDALGDFIRGLGSTCHMIISPGYLSKADTTIGSFWTELDKSIKSTGTSSVKLYIFRGMNGDVEIKTKGTTGATVTKAILEVYDDIIGETRKWSKTKFENAEVDYGELNDHRKMIFFFQERKGKKWSGKLSRVNLSNFLKKITIKGILIGSSNFSYNTYYNGGSGKAEKGEADLFMFVDDNYQVAIRNKTSAGTGMVLFKHEAGVEDPQKFFKKILKDFLENSLK